MTIRKMQRPRSDTLSSSLHVYTPGYVKTCRNKLIDIALCSAILMCILQRPAHAYIDPGAGSMLWQMLIGVFMGTAFYVSRFISRIRKNKDHHDEE